MTNPELSTRQRTGGGRPRPALSPDLQPLPAATGNADIGGRSEEGPERGTPIRARRTIQWLLRTGLPALTALVCTACGAPAMIGPEPNEPSVEPQAVGAAEHLEAAKREELRLARHQALYDPRAKQSIRRCNPMPEGRRSDAPDCWIETINPTAIHDMEIRVHGERAVYHRKAARDLRDAEALACKGVATNARESDPFSRGDVLGVAPLHEPAKFGSAPRLLGAIVFLQPIAGVTLDELQSIMECYSAHQAVIGFGPITTETDRSPLKEPGSRATVRQLGHGYAIEVRADDAFAAQAIWLRAQRLAVTR